MPDYSHQASADDPELVPVRHAATVMIVADGKPGGTSEQDSGLHVLMVQRTSRAVFGPSAWVFPGGRVDPEDEQDLSEVVTGLTSEEASNVLDVESDGRAWWFAGLRETVEEAGLVLGAAGAPLAAIERTRDAVHADAGAFAEALRENGLQLDLSQMYEVARFITPVGPPRRFDTRFFVTRAPVDQTARHDDEEVVQHAWIRPGTAIDPVDEDDFPMMSVTHRMLASLARYESVDELMQVSAEQRPEQRVRVNDPAGAYEVVLPGDPGYETAELEVEHGWVRI